MREEVEPYTKWCKTVASYRQIDGETDRAGIGEVCTQRRSMSGE